MDLLGNWNSLFSQMTWRQVDPSVSTAEIGDMIEFAHPWSGLSLWGVYVGDGRVIHFGVGDENMTQRACRSFLQQMVPKSKGERVLRKTRICTQRITEIKVPPGTRIRVNNNKHNMVPSPQEMMQNRCETFLHQEFNYDLLNFNSEHFATFVRYGNAVCNQSDKYEQLIMLAQGYPELYICPTDDRPTHYKQLLEEDQLCTVRFLSRKRMGIQLKLCK